MIVMNIATYPMSSIPKVVEIFIENMKTGIPDYIKMTGPYSRWGGEGITAFVIYDIQDDRIMEGMKELGARDARYAAAEGYKIESSVLLSIEDSLSLVGEKMS